MQRLLLNAASPGTQQAASALFKTAIVTSVVTTTIPSISLCIPAAQFSDGAAAKPCARRRRDIAQKIHDVLAQFTDDENQSAKAVQPSPIERYGIHYVDRAATSR